MTLETEIETVDTAHHNDNQRRFIELEKKIDANTRVTSKLASDTAELVEMWKDVGVVFKWLKKIGGFIIWVRNVALAGVALYVLWRYGIDNKQ